MVATTRATSERSARSSIRGPPRIRNVKIADGFNSNTALFRYARDLGNKRADMYEIAVFDETIARSGREIMFAINIPQESVVIPESIDAVRAALSLQTDRLEAVALTNKYLGMPAGAPVAAVR